MAQMTDADALDPIPNAIFFNWATIFVLAFGNLAALDFQACSMCMHADVAMHLPVAGCTIFHFAALVTNCHLPLTNYSFQARVFAAKTPNTAVFGCIAGE